MNLTLFVDASLHHKSGSAGWGAWAIAATWKESRLFGAPILETVASPNEAEIVGIAEAVVHLRDDAALQDADFVVIQADNLRALELLATFGGATPAKAKEDGTQVVANPKLKMTAMEASAIERFAAARPPAPIYVRHVKGHSQGSGRHRVNHHCDAEAKRQAHIARKLRGDL